MTKKTKTVRAAGGVVYRKSPKSKNTIEVLAVHRPRYNDWSLPKGKADEGESFVDCALREVEEETGFKPVQGQKVDSVAEYVVNKSRNKIVHYWLMTTKSGRFVANDEVDVIKWVTFSKLENAAHIRT